MSFYFNLQTPKRITFQQLNNELDNTAICFTNSDPNSEEEIGGTKIYLPHQSTRGITLGFQEDEYSIGINVIASEVDFHLAISIAKSIAKLTGALITPEDEESAMNAEELVKSFDQSWIDMMKTAAVDLFLEKIGNEGHVLSIGCCHMSYSIGPKIHATLDQSSKENYYSSLVAHIQKTQFFDLEKYAIPNILAATSQDGANRTTYLVFYPTGNQFLAKADYVVFPQDEGKYEIPFEMLSQIATDKFTLIDEEQYTVDGISESEYDALIQKIEEVLNQVDDAELKQKFSIATKEELDQEFNRIAAVPNARTKIFALKRMSVLMKEYEQRGIAMPNSTGGQKQEAPAKPKMVKEQKSKVIVEEPKKATKNPKKWWKFW